MFKPGNRSSQVTHWRWKKTSDNSVRGSTQRGRLAQRKQPTRWCQRRLVLHEETPQESVWMRDVIVTLQEAGGRVGAREDFDLIPSAML
ncbi:hypothetical protein CTRI78_v006827 [Colletotrichum trifolii]|uniref:Uncharacterized protein n=1 Tax=Colletotrichum trifolii TaxID=5466 RepID=A0A4R8RBA1_COLTR|nr:hypothetical protein CTRI78_v006827 [Colletotrichum trifolii]